MNMIGYPSNLQEDPSFSSKDAAHVFVKRFTDFGPDRRLTVLGGEDEVIEQVRKGRGHGRGAGLLDR